MVKNTIEINNILDEEESKMCETPSEEGKMRKIGKCANFGEVILDCELVGYDIKTLNTATGKGSYLLKVGSKTVTVPYTSAKKETEKWVELVLYKLKQFLQGFWYRVFNITQNKEAFIYIIEEKIPEYPAALVKKVLVKSLRPETSWLRIQ